MKAFVKLQFFIDLLFEEVKLVGYICPQHNQYVALSLIGRDKTYYLFPQVGKVMDI